jgi:mRNA deadenylase 3'-5' endonuclease subunit Ccr4
MLNKSGKYEDNNFVIIGTFTRSFDTSHINNNRIHLISSICLIKGAEEKAVIANFLSLCELTNKDKYQFVFVLTTNVKFDYKTPSVVTIDNLVIIHCELSDLLKGLLFTDKSNSY